LFVARKIQNRNIALLVDTGANVTIISNSFFKRADLLSQININSVSMNVITAIGEITPFIGEAIVKIDPSGDIYEHKVLIADIKNDGILEVDFLTLNKCDVLLSRKCLLIGNQKIKCFQFKRDAEPSECRVSVTVSVEIPASSEIIVPGRISGILPTFDASMVEPVNNFAQREGLCLARTLIDPRTGIVHLRLVNVNKNPYTLHQDTVVATLNPVILHVPSINECQSVNKAVINETNESVPNEIPDHLHNIFENVSESLTHE